MESANQFLEKVLNNRTLTRSGRRPVLFLLSLHCLIFAAHASASTPGWGEGIGHPAPACRACSWVPE
jgi:hypothetical protein